MVDMVLDIMERQESRLSSREVTSGFLCVHVLVPFQEGSRSYNHFPPNNIKGSRRL